MQRILSLLQRVHAFVALPELVVNEVLQAAALALAARPQVLLVPADLADIFAPPHCCSRFYARSVKSLFGFWKRRDTLGRQIAGTSAH